MNDYFAVSLIIPNFNGAHILSRNLPAVIEAARVYKGDSEIIVVDDGSHDGSLSVLEGYRDRVVVVKHETNRGFSEAIHSGVERAAHELLIFLNSDVRPDPQFISPLLDHFGDLAVFSVSPLILHENGSVNRYSWNRKQFVRGKLKSISWTLDEALRVRRDGPIPTLYTSGGSMALRKSMFKALGGFLPIYKPFYVEDYDLGVRAWRRGWKNLFEPLSRIVHEDGGAIEENVKSTKVKRIQRRNGFLFHWIHLPARRLWFTMFPRYLRQITGRVLRFDSVYLMGLLDALARLPEVLEVRRELSNAQYLADFETCLDKSGAVAEEGN